MVGFFSHIKEYLSLASYKKSSTLSGAIVFFAILGIVPITYIISVILSIFGTEIEIINKIFSYKEFNEIASYLTETAIKMGTRGNIFIFLVALYSSANIFYHLRQSGEMIFNCNNKSTILNRIITILLTFITVLIFALALAFYVAVIPVLYNLLGGYISTLINVIVGISSVFIMSLLINYYVCPYKLKLYEVYKGALLTTVFSFVMSFLFFIYIRKFSNFNEVYGKIATVIVFLSWLYLMVNGLFKGILLNVYLMGRVKSKNLVKKSEFVSLKAIKKYKK